MQANNFSILCTSDMDSFQDLFLPENISIDIIPMIEKKIIDSKKIRAATYDLFNKNITAIFTSKTAVLAIAASDKNMQLSKIYCIENSTKKTVEQYFPMSVIVDSAGNAKDLAKKIIDHSESEVVFFCGNKRLDVLPILLNEAKINLKEFIVYETIITPKKITQQYDAIIFLSPSAVHSFFSKNTTNSSTTFFVLGKKTVDAIRHFSNNQFIIAHYPDKEIILKKAIDFLHKQTIAQ